MVSPSSPLSAGNYIIMSGVIVVHSVWMAAFPSHLDCSVDSTLEKLDPKLFRLAKIKLDELIAELKMTDDKHSYLDFNYFRIAFSEVNSNSKL
jgi:hypothetical protein